MSAQSSDTPVTFIVQVKDQKQTGIVAAALRERGLHVNRVLNTVGVVGGTGPSALKQVLSQTPGVGFVREEGGFQLPPFDERVAQ